MASSRLLKKAHLLRCARSPREFVFVIRVRARPDFTTTSSRSRSRYKRASHLNLFDQPGISCIALRVQLEAPRGRISRLELPKFQVRDRSVAANLPNTYQLGGPFPVALRLAGDLRAGGLLQPGAHFYGAAGGILQLGQIQDAEFIFAMLQVHAWHQRVEATADLQRAQHPVNEVGQMLGIGETAEHVGNDLEFSKLLGRIVPQTLAEEIPHTVITETHGLMSPLV